MGQMLLCFVASTVFCAGLSLAQVSTPAVTTDPPAPVVIGSNTLSEVTQYALGSQTLTPGGIITDDGQVISLGSDGGFIVNDEKSSTLSQIVIAGQTLGPSTTLSSSPSAVESTSESSTGTAAFTMPTEQPLIRGEPFTVSWKGASADVQIFFESGTIGGSVNTQYDVGNCTYSIPFNETPCIDGKLLDGQLKIPPISYFVNDTLPLGPYYFTLVDYGGTISPVKSQQYTLYAVCTIRTKLTMYQFFFHVFSLCRI
jgi:hypothetical protein